MKKNTVLAIITAALLIIASNVQAEISFLNDQRGITTHVIINNQVYPISNNGMVTVNGKIYTIDELALFARGDIQNGGDMQNRKIGTNTDQRENGELKNTTNGIKRDVRREVRRTVGGRPGAGIVTGVAEDLLGSIFR